ncbi:Fur-regulated basic protein FbpA [Bacillus sp. 03113]|uniref:Fur-regulated basic protein FbpA n=1 Tax=Bacillus sp. 03113 TaxID=2578211 RepID=UPI00215C84A3|nr:Fur-regulated basic protein FbpA [Bacillus sp. 03113]
MENAAKQRNSLINKLIRLGIDQEDGHLYELTLAELEKEYRKSVCRVHPHSGFGSINWRKG